MPSVYTAALVFEYEFNSNSNGRLIPSPTIEILGSQLKSSFVLQQAKLDYHNKRPFA